MGSTILHCDMNNFYASVELLDHPELKNQPVAVCGSDDHRHGIILAKNQLARSYGITTAETLWQARKKCPQLVCLPPHMSKYKHYSQLINEIYYEFTDLVEPYSIDESWLDVTASHRLFGDGKTIADTLRHRIQTQLGLTLSVGVSYNKIFAKMGSAYKKPDATTVITSENFRQVFWPLPAGRLFTVGKATEMKLKKMGIETIGDLAQSDPLLLEKQLGKQGSMIHDYANGKDQSPVREYHHQREIKTVGNGMTFHRNLCSKEDIHTAVIGLSDMVSGRLRKYNKKALGIKIEIKDPKFKTLSRQKQLTTATYTAQGIAQAAFDLINAHWKADQPIRLLAITGFHLVEPNYKEELQLNFLSPRKKEKPEDENLDKAMDDIRKKYGTSSISFGRLMDTDIGFSNKK